MGNPFESNTDLPEEQRAIRAKCFHPSGAFVEFKKEDIEQSIAARFEQQAAKYDDRIAVKSKNHTLSYSQLNRLANRIARGILVHCGAGQGPVGVLVAEDALTIAAIFGVLKAGKFFVPMDPSFPTARIVSIAEDSQAESFLTDNENLSLARELNLKKRPVININGLDADFSDDKVGLPVSPDALAYILYTSGSTGEPKGIVQNQRNTLHVTMTYTNSVHIGVDDRLTLLFSGSTSAGVYGIFRALLNGASLYPFKVKAEGVSHIAGWLAQHEITVYSSVPTLFRHFCETLTVGEKFPHLRLIELLGEPVYKRDVDSYKRHFSRRCFLANWLGSTEAGVVRCYIMNQRTRIDSDVLPAGYAIPDREVLLLNDDGKEVGVGDVGEIVVKSRYLSPGYWQKPDRTRDVFLPSGEAGDERVYLTGDLGRMLPDGCLVQLGRKDYQVKVRGQRVEIAEVEIALVKHAAIKEAVVVAQDDLRDEKRLVAYVVPNRKDTVKTTELRAFLEQKLPDYMVPSAFVPVDSLPLLPNGKVDRQALPPLDRARVDETAFVAPRTPLEAKLAEIWREILGVKRVSIHDNFFDLGGHSLLAGQIVSRVRDVFHLSLPVVALLERPTVADLAVAVTEQQAEQASSERLDEILAELEQISDDDARTMQAEKNDMAINDKSK